MKNCTIVSLQKNKLTKKRPPKVRVKSNFWGSPQYSFTFWSRKQMVLKEIKIIDDGSVIPLSQKRQINFESYLGKEVFLF